MYMRLAGLKKLKVSIGCILKIPFGLEYLCFDHRASEQLVV